MNLSVSTHVKNQVVDCYKLLTSINPFLELVNCHHLVNFFVNIFVIKVEYSLQSSQSVSDFKPNAHHHKERQSNYKD